MRHGRCGQYCAPAHRAEATSLSLPKVPRSLWLRSAGTDKRRSLWTAWHFAAIQDYTDQPQRQQSLGDEAPSFIESSHVWSASLTLPLSPAQIEPKPPVGEGISFDCWERSWAYRV